MDFDTAKENIQPLASGRNVRFLEAAFLNSTNPHSHNEELLKQRKEFEDAILNYEGDDPLQPWYDYVAWIEQSYPSGGKESGLEEVLMKCLSRFENNPKYLQDRRMIKLYIKYIDTQPNPTEYYQELYNEGIGTTVADLYICWAYHYDLSGNFQKAESVFRKGLDAKAKPFDILDEAHKHFGFTMSQRILHKDEENYELEFLESMRERRNALTSLRSHRKNVGSIRTGIAVKNHLPGKVHIDKKSNQSASGYNDTNKSNFNGATLSIFEDQNNPNLVSVDDTINHPVDVSRSQSLIRSIIDSARKQENMIEPGPWSKAKEHSQRLHLSSNNNHSLPFEILEDDESTNELKNGIAIASLPPIPLPDELNNYAKGIKLPKNHVTRNNPQKEWKVPIIIDENNNSDKISIPQYDKFHLYPKRNHVYSNEELLGYKWCKKNGIENTLTKRLDPIWLNQYETGIRLFPTFKKKNNPQEEFHTKRFIEDDTISNGNYKFAIKFNEIYPEDNKDEFQIEEILCKKWKEGERKLKFCPDDTIWVEEDMDETRCTGNNGFDVYSRRNSFFPRRESLLLSRENRKSVAPSRRSVLPSVSLIKECDNELSSMENLGNISSVSVKTAAVVDDKNTSRKSVIIENPLNITRDNKEIGNADELKAIENQKEEILQSAEETPEYQAEGAECKLVQKMLSVSLNDRKSVNSHLENDEYKTPKSVEVAQPVQSLEKLDLSDISKTKTKIKIFKHLESDKNEKEQEIKSTVDCNDQNSTNILLKFQNNENQEPEIVVQKSKILTEKIEIYEDEDDFQFKIPKLPITNPTTCALDVFNPSPPTCDNESPLFDANETCSTQLFNLCIKPQSISTPLKGIINRTNEDGIQAQNYVSPPELPSKQLSTILEISEPVTASSASSGGATSTKSSNYNQFSSPESENEILSRVNNNQSPLKATVTPATGAIKKNTIFSVEGVPKPHNFISKQSKPTDTSYLYNKEETVPSLITSMKIFEEKTDTISKMILVSNASKPSIPHPVLKLNSPSPPPPLPSTSIKNFKEESLLDALLKTPEKIVNSSASKLKRNKITCNDDLSLTDFENFTLPKKLDEIKDTKKFQLFEDSPIELNFSLKNYGIKFDDILKPNLEEKSILKSEIQLPKPTPIELDKSLKTEYFKQPLEKCKQDVFIEDNDCTHTFIPNATGIKSSTFLLKSMKLTDENSFKKNIDKEQNFTKHKKHSLSSEKLFQFSENIEKQELHKIPLINHKSIYNINTTVNESMNISGSIKPNKKSILSKFSEISRRQSNSDNDKKILHENENLSSVVQLKQQQKQILNKQNDYYEEEEEDVNHDDDDYCEQSIYKNFNSKNLISGRHAWLNNDNEININENEKENIQIVQLHSKNKFIEQNIDLNQSHQVIANVAKEVYVNPFKRELLQAFLDNIEFIDYIKKFPNCLLLNKIPFLKRTDIIKVNDKQFEVGKIIGEGSYGTIFSAKEKTSGKMYALKQEKPANLWEYYICIEIKSRLRNPDLLSAFMDVEYSVIGNNAGILISEYAKFGSLINVCNKVKRCSNKNLDEYIVMILSSQILSAIDHLHSCSIIHADIKADNFLLMSKITYGDKKPAIQLIDFGCSIDVEQFDDGQKFNYIFESNDFKCIEMRENRPWTFQIDLYGIAGTIHVLLFGKYMTVEKKLNEWMHTTVVPRYFKKSLWQKIFHTLLNVADCNTMPNLQELKTSLEIEIHENEKIVRDKISQFNMYIDS